MPDPCIPGNKLLSKTPRIGTTIGGRYRIEGEIGRGVMGTVYRAHDTLLDRPVAVKVVSATGLGTEGHSRLLQEAQAAVRLNHPNIVAVYDVGTAPTAGDGNSKPGGDQLGDPLLIQSQAQEVG